MVKSPLDDCARNGNLAHIANSAAEFIWTEKQSLLERSPGGESSLTLHLTQHLQVAIEAYQLQIRVDGRNGGHLEL